MGRSQGELIKKISDKELLLHLYTTQFLLLAVACILSFFLFESSNEMIKLWQWNLSEIMLYGGGSALIVILLDSLLMKILPEGWYDDGGVNERVFADRPVWHIFILALVIAFTEELLFRGVIQTHFGLVFASVLFAVLHIRYLSKFILFFIVISLSFFLGWIFAVTGNLAVTVFSHFIIDFVFALIMKYSKEKKVSVHV